MQLTRYRIKSPSRHAYRVPRASPDARSALSGREAPLVLIKEHLTEQIFPASPSYVVACVGGIDRKGWNVPSAGVSRGCNEFGGNFVAKIQPFDAGGYELSCRSLYLEKIGATMVGVRRMGKRERPETVDRENVLKAAQRAKRRVRHLTRNMGASHLVTFTRRETEATGFASAEQWGQDWDKLRRLIVRAKGEFPYVAVLEKHKKGNYHLHVAWVEAPGQKVNLNLVRGCWWAVLGGRGQGNVDAQYIKVRAGVERADRVAKYISKYTTKHFEEEGRFNKKRYWSSKQDMPAVRRYVLNTVTCSQALAVVQNMLGLDLGDYMRKGRDGSVQFDGFFPFPDGSGFWMTYIPDKHGGAPPPF